MLYLPLLSILCCCQSEKHEITFEEQKNWEVDRGVSIEISMPYGDSLRFLGVCWDKNPIDVIIRNQSDSVIYFYEDWNSWGYYNIKFQIAQVRDLIKETIDFAIKDMDKPTKSIGKTISKIKKN